MVHELERGGLGVDQPLERHESHESQQCVQRDTQVLRRNSTPTSMQLERRLGMVFAYDHPLLLANILGDVISRHRRVADGKPPWERLGNERDVSQVVSSES